MADLLEYWRAIELFAPPTLAKPTKISERKAGTEWVQPVAIRDGGPLPALPWQPGHLLSEERPRGGRYGASWRHTVYGGVFSLDTVRTSLADRFGFQQEEDYAGRRKAGETAVFAFTVDERGILLEDTAVFSSCAWATGRILDPGPGDSGWLDGFDTISAECAMAVLRLTHHYFSYDPGTDSASPEGWRKPIGEILGSAAENAVSALIASLSGMIGAVGVGLLSGVAKPVMDRLGKRLAGKDEAPDENGETRETKPQEDEKEHGGGPGRPLLLPDVVAFAAHVADVCGVSHLVDHRRFLIHSRPVSRKKDGSLPDPEPPFLNSLLPEDLERVAAAASGGYGAALTRYLTAPSAVPAGDRIDVRERRDVVIDGVSPAAFTLGRWPADTDKPLALSQQFAVNGIVAELMHGAGLFSVNGPPGTGKSTLLRDLIAAIVVERAVRLSKFATPDQAFKSRFSWTTDDGMSRSVRALDPSLTGFEVVVAASNNGAVENITAELPALGAIGDEWQGETSYFLEQATSLLGAPAWGTVAVPLGNREKRRLFLDRFWWGGNRAVGMQELLQQLEADPVLYDPPAKERFPEGTTRPASLPDDTPPTPTGWPDAVARFRKALDDVTRMRNERGAAEDALRHRTSVADEREAKLRAADTERDWAEICRRREYADQEARSAEHAVQAIYIELDQHAATRPRGLGSLLGAGRTIQAWRERDGRLQARLSAQLTILADARARADAAIQHERAARRAADQVAEAAKAIAARRAADERRIERARAAWGDSFPGDWDERDDEQRELSAPWSDDEWLRARTRLFLAALDLHRAFVTDAARTIRINLLQLAKKLSGERGAPPPDAELAAWQTLFLLVPVVSTTFASCGRLFSALGRESLGWVLVDEAGQAAPQAAVGALWRARRAVLVGDPLQLEPVVPLPEAVQELLRQCYGVGPEWLPSRVSAQSVADRVNRMGTSVARRRKDGELETVWVGAPLRVHRRCERPMFEISNAIAYDHLMVYGTAEKQFPDEKRTYSRSSWVDVVSADTEGKWVPAEGTALTQMLEKLHRRCGVGLDRIRVLSPFRDVVKGCKAAVQALDWAASPLPGVKGYEKQVSEFINANIGTVHTMQGKEADVVILVLGTHPQHHKGARDWASETSNLLNVAVSRAKRRLFVIGNHEVWSQKRYFDTLATELPRHSWPSSSGTAG
ncbi:ATP-binding protein [Actinoallomurus purpureus]|nr:ATP-binding protein [Actinoallomurus purpureus]